MYSDTVSRQILITTLKIMCPGPSSSVEDWIWETTHSWRDNLLLVYREPSPPTPKSVNEVIFEGKKLRAMQGDPCMHVNQALGTLATEPCNYSPM